MEVRGQLHAPAAFPLVPTEEKSERLSQPARTWSYKRKSHMPLSVFEYRTAEPTASYYTDWATQVPQM